MKKTLLAAFTAIVILSSGMFASAQESDFPDEKTADFNLDTTSRNEESSSQEKGISFGARFSVLGVEPEFSFIYSNFEVAVFSPLVEGESYKTDEDLFGPGIGTSIGYTTDPFEKGWQNSIGLSYLFLPEDYMEVSIIGKIFNDNGHDIFLQDLHLLSMYYRGTVKFNDKLGMSFRAELPLFVGSSNGNKASIIGDDAWVCWLILPCSASLGLRFELPF